MCGRFGARRVVWLGLAGLYAMARVGRASGWLSGPADWYLTDLLCLPLVLGLALQVQRLCGRSRDWSLPCEHGLVAAAGYGLYFEWLLPRLDARFVADPGDFLCYLLGWLLFEFLLNRPLRTPLRDPRVCG
jgi:hypothetical protein